MGGTGSQDEIVRVQSVVVLTGQRELDDIVLVHHQFCGGEGFAVGIHAVAGDVERVGVGGTGEGQHEGVVDRLDVEADGLIVLDAEGIGDGDGEGFSAVVMGVGCVGPIEVFARVVSAGREGAV